MKSLVDLSTSLLRDCGRQSGAAVERDVLTLRSRVEHEGDSFITITLPDFAKDFDKALDDGGITPLLFRAFAKGREGKPKFLGSFLDDVFGKDGSLLPEPSITAIRLVRQVCLFGKKILRDCSRERQEAAIEGFKRCDDEVVEPCEDPLTDCLRQVSDIIMSDLEFEDEDGNLPIRCQHGPGSTQERIFGNQKWLFPEWHERLESVGLTYHFSVFGRHLPLWGDEFHDSGDLPHLVQPEDEQPVRVCLVPKTLRTPRIIAIEPVCMQFVQQGLSGLLVEQLHRCSLTTGHVVFDDQSVNQKLALDASRTGNHATLDMSEASDRVSAALVWALFRKQPFFRSALFAARSNRAKLPDGSVVNLRKFASMGSATCFPVEALTFFMSIIASIMSRRGIYPTRRSVHLIGREVYVFGDDLIVPNDEAPAVRNDLESLGFRVNLRKSFWTGKFRESCGWDCFDGELVTPVYLKEDVPADRNDVKRVLSCVAKVNQLHKAGYLATANLLKQEVEGVLGKLPQVPLKSPAIGWHFPSEKVLVRRWDKHTQQFLYRCLVVCPAKADDPIEGSPALAKCLRVAGTGDSAFSFRDYSREGELQIVTSDPDHLLTSVSRYGLALKRRWVPSTLWEG